MQDDENKQNIDDRVESKKKLYGDRAWNIECWFVWIITIFMAVSTLGARVPGNPYVAALFVMAFMHYFNDSKK